MLFLPKVQGDVDENYARTIRSLHWEADFTRSGVVVPRLLASRQTSSGVRSSRDERTPEDVCLEASKRGTTTPLLVKSASQWSERIVRA